MSRSLADIVSPFTDLSIKLSNKYVPLTLLCLHYYQTLQHWREATPSTGFPLLHLRADSGVSPSKQLSLCHSSPALSLVSLVSLEYPTYLQLIISFLSLPWQSHLQKSRKLIYFFNHFMLTKYLSNEWKTKKCMEGKLDSFLVSPWGSNKEK